MHGTTLATATWYSGRHRFSRSRDPLAFVAQGARTITLTRGIKSKPECNDTGRPRPPSSLRLKSVERLFPRVGAGLQSFQNPPAPLFPVAFLLVIPPLRLGGFQNMQLGLCVTPPCSERGAAERNDAGEGEALVWRGLLVSVPGSTTPPFSTRRRRGA